MEAAARLSVDKSRWKPPPCARAVAKASLNCAAWEGGLPSPCSPAPDSAAVWDQVQHTRPLLTGAGMMQAAQVARGREPRQRRGSGCCGKESCRVPPVLARALGPGSLRASFSLSGYLTRNPHHPAWAQQASPLSRPSSSCRSCRLHRGSREMSSQRLPALARQTT